MVFLCIFLWKLPSFSFTFRLLSPSLLRLQACNDRSSGPQSVFKCHGHCWTAHSLTAFSSRPARGQDAPRATGNALVTGATLTFPRSAIFNRSRLFHSLGPCHVTRAASPRPAGSAPSNVTPGAIPGPRTMESGQSPPEAEQLEAPQDIERLAESLRASMRGWEPLLAEAQRLLVWERPLYSLLTAAALNGAFWLLSSTSLRPVFLLSVSFLGLLVIERWKSRFQGDVTVQPVSEPDTDSENVTLAVSGAAPPRLLSFPELCHCLAESWVTCRLYLQELLQYKRQHPGKFCAYVCSGCLSLTVVGHYVPGIMISYIILLSVLLWPLVVYHELIQRMYTGLEPILMKLDYSMKGEETLHHKHEKRNKQGKKEPERGDEPMAETDSESEVELSSFSPLVDVKTTALALAITDSELSDEEASILESGGFSVSRATTPQLTDVSEDLDQQSMHSDPEESFSKDLTEFPSVEEYHSRDQEPGDKQEAFVGPLEVQAPEATDSGLTIQTLASPLHFVNSHFNGQSPTNATPNLGMAIEALSEELVTTAITTVVQNTLSALLRSSEASEEPSISEFLPSEPQGDVDFQAQTEAVAAAEEDAEDFELLDQTELEQIDAELGLGGQKEEQELPTAWVANSSSSASSPSEQHEETAATS